MRSTEILTEICRVENTKAGDLRGRIIEAAFAVLMERGYAGASTIEIATRAKVSKRDLYALFGSKQASSWP